MRADNAALRTEMQTGFTILGDEMSGVAIYLKNLGCSVLNTRHVPGIEHLEWPPNGNGEVPLNVPTALAHLRSLTVLQIRDILRFYNISFNGLRLKDQLLAKMCTQVLGIQVPGAQP